MVDIAEFTRSQIDALSLDPKRPVIISDADEVIVHLARPLELFLTARGFLIDLSDYRLFGNVRHPDGTEVEMEPLMALLDEFFEAEVENLPPVAGAVDALCALGERAQVVVLTNLPDLYRERRMRHFTSCGLDAPIVANVGLKGKSAKAIAARVEAPVVFIDDTAPHIRSVAETVPDSFRVHFIADERLAAAQARAKECHHRCDRWPTTHLAVERFLDGQGY